MDTAVPASSPGSLLRAARQARGMDLDTLALSIKVAPRKLEALEADRYDELPDPGFVRALALTVCRVLGQDSAPVLAGLPSVSQGAGLEHVTRGLDQPFDRTGLRLGALADAKVQQVLRPSVIAPALLLVAAAAVYFFWPEHLARPDAAAPQAASAVPAEPAVEPGTRIEPAEPASGAASDAAPARSAAATPSTPASVPPAVPVQASVALDLRSSSQIGNRSAAVPVPAAVAAQASSAARTMTPAAAPAALPAAAPAVAAGSAPVLSTREASWIEARDARGRAVLSRLLQPGEQVVLDGRGPWRIKVGNARGTDLSFNGKPVNLQPHTRDNVARLELQ